MSVTLNKFSTLFDKKLYQMSTSDMHWILSLWGWKMIKKCSRIIWLSSPFNSFCLLIFWLLSLIQMACLILVMFILRGYTGSNKEREMFNRSFYFIGVSINVSLLVFVSSHDDLRWLVFLLLFVSLHPSKWHDNFSLEVLQQSCSFQLDLCVWVRKRKNACNCIQGAHVNV